MKAWIDIDNPPQVQYLAPFIEVFERHGIDVGLTARDYGITRQLLGQRAITHCAVGGEFGAGRVRKMAGTIERTLRLARIVGRSRPALLLSTSRSAVMAAWMLGIPSFMVLDYEHVELGSFRLTRTTVLHPDIIDSEVFREKGFTSERIIPFAGIKEDISFGGFDLDAVPAHQFDTRAERTILVLVRPPSETSHYFDAATRDLTRELLARLASNSSVRIVFSPRHPDQVEALRVHHWSHEPIVLERPVEFISLLKGVDWVVCAGGTMLREAAYLGVPAISVFRGEIGAVDRWLEALGAVRFASNPGDLDAINWAEHDRVTRVPHRRHAVDEIVQRILASAETHRRGLGRRRFVPVGMASPAVPDQPAGRPRT
jgi:uncharacterized protein